jgi:ferrochelatase
VSRIGVMLINLGTPKSPYPKDVYAYLKQFLNDPRVIDLPLFIRYFLVNWIVLPFRYKKSSIAYQKIWTENGSPLLINSQDLVSSLSQELGNPFQVALGMRYGNPSIKQGFEHLKECNKIIAIPLFPQYSCAATGSAIEELLRTIGSQLNIPEIHIKKDFYCDPDFINAYTNLIKPYVHNKQIEKVIFSYHGLPVRQLEKGICNNTTCSKNNDCPSMQFDNLNCYRAQCYETSRLIASSLYLDRSQYEVSFQSRLGKTPWIKPYTDITLIELRKKNINNIAIVCPSFVADCLETLEEINIKAREQWSSLGGNEFLFIPSLNNGIFWVKSLKQMVYRMM